MEPEPRALLVAAGPGTGWCARARAGSPPSSLEPVMKSHSGAENRSRIDMVLMNWRTSSLWLAQHLLGQVVTDEPVAVADLADELVRVGPSRHRQRGEVEARRPSLGALHQVTDRSLGQVHVLDGQQGRGLVGREGQLGGADLRESAGRPQPGRSGDPGSARVMITRCACWGRCSTRNSTWRWQSTSRRTWKSSSRMMRSSSMLAPWHASSRGRTPAITSPPSAAMNAAASGPWASGPLEGHRDVGPEPNRVVVAGVE